MSQMNIFNGDKSIENLIKSKLGESSRGYYFEAFFYLTKRFGMPEVWDELKQAGAWDFKVKNYTIRIDMNSSFVTIMIFGDLKNFKYIHARHSDIARHRGELKLCEDQKFTDTFESPELSKAQELANKFIWVSFCLENKIDESWTQSMWDNAEMSIKWYDYVRKTPDRINNVDYSLHEEKYKHEYMNSNKKHALKTVEQFINNMLTSIRVRDCYFNILGRCDGEFDKYKGNINIECINEVKNG